MRHARGLVADRELDREGLKQSLLALKKYWDPKKEPRVEDIVLHRCIDGFHVSHPCIEGEVNDLTRRVVRAAGDGCQTRFRIRGLAVGAHPDMHGMVRHGILHTALV